MFENSKTLVHINYQTIIAIIMYWTCSILPNLCEFAHASNLNSSLHVKNSSILQCPNQMPALKPYLDLQFSHSKWGVTTGIPCSFIILLFNQCSGSVVSNSLRPHELQHARPPCPSPTPGVYSNSCPLSQWCHPTISSSVIPFSSCPQSFSPSGSFQMSQLFVSGGQSMGVSASASVLPMNTHGWSPLGWTSWISLQSKGLSRVFSNTTPH